MAGTAGGGALSSHFDMILDGVGAAVIIVDEEERIVAFNSGAEHLTGWGANEAKGRLFADVVGLEPQREELDEADAAGEDEPPATKSKLLAQGAWLKRKSGDDVFVRGTASKLRKKEGLHAECLYTLRDETEELSSRRRLKQSETRFRLLFENLGSLSSLYEVVRNEAGKPVDYRYLEINPALERLLGRSACDLRGKTLREVFPETETHWLEAFAEVIETGKPRILEQYSQVLDTHVELTLFRPQPEQMAMISTDITERRRAEIALRKSEEMYRFLTENLKDVVWSVDIETQRFTYVSPSIEAMRGYSPEELMVQPVSDSVVESMLEPLQQMTLVQTKEFLDAEKAGTVPPFHTVELLQPHKNGNPIWTESVTRYRRNQSTGKIEAFGLRA